jgi:predicted secreted hydrolase
LTAQLLAGCGGAPILANEPLAFPSPALPSAGPSPAADPIPVSFPLDDGPHHRLTEWWYYTGHLVSADGRPFGFEAVIFRAERGSVPAAWASHVALTDVAGHRFLYAQRSEIGPQVDHSPRDRSGEPTGFDLVVGVPGTDASPWQLAGSDGADHIEVALAPPEAVAAGASFGFELDLASTKPAALHDGDGFVNFGPAGSSYYYSRTRLAATGTLELDGERLSVEGIAWFDHQWGDFVSVGGGGWDWFAINLEDGTDITMSIVRDAALEPIVQYGTFVDISGGTTTLGAADFHARPNAQWTSSKTGRTYPSGWTIGFRDAELLLTPVLQDQELDTRATTGVIYWEGANMVSLRRPADPGAPLVDGDAYVEVTRYGP